jgi:cytoskeleton protein RodZ
MSEAGESLGGRLKAERERKGFSTQKAADQLHLDAWVIEALESGDYARIGPAVYGKGHLKRYAGLLGLPADEIVGAYETRPAAPVEAAQTPALRMRAAETEDRAPPWATVAGVAVISVLVAAAAVLWWQPWLSRRFAAPAGPASSTTVAARGSGAPQAAGGESANGGPADGGPTDRRPAAGVVGSGSLADGTTPGGAHSVTAAAGAADDSVAPGATEPVPGVGHARLRLSFSADSWVEVHDASGRRLFAGRGHANSVKTIAGAAPMKVYLGFASGVQLEVNNRVVAIGPQFVAGDVAHFEAGADGVLRRDPHAAAAGDPHPRG